MNEQDEIKWLRTQMENQFKTIDHLNQIAEIEQSRIAGLEKHITYLEERITSYQSKIKAYSEAVKNLNVAIYDIH